MNSYSGSGCWSMEEKVVYSCLVLPGKEVRKTTLRKRPKKNLGIKGDLMSDVTCNSEEWWKYVLLNISRAWL